MRIVVTGGAGFIGSHIAQAYCDQGHRVWIVDDCSTGRKEYVPAAATLCEWDIADPRVEALLRKEKIELINHHAAHIDIRNSVLNPVMDARTNILGFLSLLEAARNSGVKRFIFASTGGAIYGEQREFPAAETHPEQPNSPYAVSKVAGEKYLECYQRVHGIVPQILRYANVYGPRQNPLGEAGVIAIFAAKMLKGQTPVIHGTGRQTRDFVYVQDVVTANLLALANPQACVFNVGTGKETNIVTIFRHVKKAAGFTGEAGHDEAKAGEQPRSVIDPSRIGEVWGWKPSVLLDVGLEKTVQWFKENRAVWDSACHA